MQNSCGYLKLNYKQVVTESLFVVAFLVSSLLGACFAMVGEISTGRVRHRGRVAISSAICLQPAPPLVRTWPLKHCLITFLAGISVTTVVFLWWLFHLDDLDLDVSAPSHQH